MSAVEDRVAALGRIEETVYGELHRGRTPYRLAKVLFDLLREAVLKGAGRSTFISAPLTRASAAEKADTTSDTNAFKTAVHRVAEALQSCRPDDRSLMPAEEDRVGVACVEAMIDGTLHLLFVRGPGGQERGAPDDALLRLVAELRPLVVEETTTPQPSRAPVRWIVASASVALLAIAALIGSAVWNWPLRLRGGRLQPFSLTIPSETSDYYAAYGAKVSRDGRRFAFLARLRGNDKRMVFVRSLSNAKATPLPVTEGEYTPFFFSADGQSIYFVHLGHLERVRGMAVQDVADVGEATRGSASSENVVVLGSSRGIVRVLPNGAVSLITHVRAEAGESQHLAPYFLPDNRTVLYVVISHGPGNDVARTLWAADINGDPAPRPIGRTPSRVELNDGHLLYVRDGALYARPFDPERLRFTGGEFRVTRGIWYSPQTGDADFSVADSGLLVVKNHAGGSKLQHVVGRRAFDVAPFGSPADLSVAMSNVVHGTVIIAAGPPGRSDLWRWDLATDRRTRLTSFGANTSPVLSSDGGTVYFAADRRSMANIYRMPASGGPESLVFAGEGIQAPRGLSPDGSLLLFQWWKQLDADLDCLKVSPPQEVSGISAVPGVVEGESGRFSPDGRWVLYTSYLSGEARVYVRAYPPRPDRQPIAISPRIGYRARWSPDGSKIDYVNGRSVMQYDFARRTLTGEIFHADDVISLFDVIGDNELLVNIGGVEPDNRVLSSWQDAAAGKIDQSAR